MIQRKLWVIPILLGIFLLLILTIPSYPDDASYLSVPRYLASLLRGEIYNTDLGQEYFGFRALLTHQDAYPVIVTGRSTHPPTAFLFAAPIAPFPWSIAPILWALLSLVVICISLVLMDFPLIFAVSATLLLAFWTPVTFSLSQITPFWLLGACLAYRERNRNAFLAGVWIGVASLTKFFPALLLAPFLIRRKWSALAGFILAWIAGLAVVFILSPSAIARYIEVNLSRSPQVIEYSNNASFFINCYKMFGIPGVALVSAVLGVIFYLNRDLFIKGEITRESWNFFSFLSVILLPIAWPYSLLPLLPGMLDRALSKDPSRLFAIFAFLIPFFFPPGAYRQIVIPALFLLMLGFVPIHALLTRKQPVGEPAVDGFPLDT